MNKRNIIWFVAVQIICALTVVICSLLFDFQSPYWLALLILVPLISVLYFWKSDEAQASLSANLEQTKSTWLDYMPHAVNSLKLLGLVLLITAFARPQEELVPKDISKEGIDIIIALDVSLSMLAKDFEPNRLEAAKRVASDFVKDRENDRIGVVVYSGESFPRVPLTSDNNMVINALSEIQNGQLTNGRLVNAKLKGGTAIGLGLASAVNRLKDVDTKSKAIILLSDGVNNQGEIKPLDAGELAKVYGITVYTIGVGSSGTALTPTQDFFGNIRFMEKPVEIDEQTLYLIAENTGGKYFRATSENKLKEIYSEIDQLEKTRYESTIIKQRTDVYWKLLLLAFGLFLSVFLIKKVLLKSVYQW